VVDWLGLKEAGLMKGLMRMRRNGLRATKALAAAALSCALAPSLLAQVSSYGDKESGPANDAPPSILNGVGIAQNLNAQLPLSLTFTDDEGKQVPLANYFGRKPAILALVYYQCPMLCSEELNGLTGALQMVDEVPGKDFNVIVVSIDPSEGTDLASAKKRSYLKRYGHPETADGWHFMTGTQANIDALTKAVGFGYVKLPEPAGTPTQYAHASSIQIVTPEGKLAQYYMGVEYSPKDLRLGLAEASSNRIGSPVDNILTYCYHYDPQTNKHSLIVARVVQLGGLVTLCTLGGFMLVMFRKDMRSGPDAPTAAMGQEKNAATGTANMGKGTKVNG
jgi:protein SCO1/2